MDTLTEPSNEHKWMLHNWTVSLMYRMINKIHNVLQCITHRLHNAQSWAIVKILFKNFLTHQTNHYTAMALQGHQISCTTIPVLLILKSKLTCGRLLCLSGHPLSLSLSLFSFYPRMELNPLVIMIATPLPGAAFPPRSVTKRETSFVCRRVESLTPHGTTCLPQCNTKN